ncbi:hypothetical protein [Psychroflexus maritimus]|uniref:Uncharacterized protein n=1 Tax=Psychroflexus maritimus TaxID=2714865 RepID=A0A967AEH5_9FLAO|nr:hypothetical protein [Psychroflexus maritimus]NGZ90098.1 hypothetical protein [Psychroflexus maritimus]
MKYIIRILAVLVLLSLFSGFYLSFSEEHKELGEKLIGFSVLGTVLFLMPLFIYHSWKGKKFSDYTLSKENLDKMREKGIDKF